MGAPKSGLLRNWQSETATIANNTAVSGSILIAGRPIVSIVMPEGWTQASLTFDITACAGGTFYPLRDGDNVEVRIQPSASTAISASQLDHLAGWYGFRIRSGCGVASAVNQGAARTFVVCKEG